MRDDIAGDPLAASACNIFLFTASQSSNFGISDSIRQFYNR